MQVRETGPRDRTRQDMVRIRFQGPRETLIRDGVPAGSERAGVPKGWRLCSCPWQFLHGGANCAGDFSVSLGKFFGILGSGADRSFRTRRGPE